MHPLKDDVGSRSIPGNSPILTRNGVFINIREDRDFSKGTRLTMDPVTDARVRVRVGETVFHTTRATLIESQLFASLFALSPPGSDEYFVDNDPELFAHVLRYLRTKLYPLFYDRVNGHDKCMYSALIHQAEFYQIPSLLTWLSDRKWMLAVRRTMKQFSHSFVGKGQMANMQAYWTRDEELTISSAAISKQRRHKCPKGIWEHDGNQGSCARHQCYLGGKAMEVPTTQVLDVEGFLTKVEVLQDLLRRGTPDSSEVIVAAMQNPPPYQAGEGTTPLPTQPLQPSSSSSAGGRSGGGGSIGGLSAGLTAGGDGGGSSGGCGVGDGGA